MIKVSGTTTTTTTTVKSGVTPNYDLTFGINMSGRTGETFNDVKDVESFDIAFDGSVAEWNPYDTQGWTRRLMTAKSISVTGSGKRNYGDAGNDYIAGLALKNGQDCNSQLKITFPNGDAIIMDCVINTTKAGGGAATDPSGLEWEALSDGKPTYKPYSVA